MFNEVCIRVGCLGAQIFDIFRHVLVRDLDQHDTTSSEAVKEGAKEVSNVESISTILGQWKQQHPGDDHIQTHIIQTACRYLGTG